METKNMTATIPEALKPYLAIADMIAETFGSNCEVVLHDLAHPEDSVVYVANSVTGREAGQSFNHLVKQVLLSPDFQDDHVSNYRFETFSGGSKRLIKSSSALIRDNAGEIIGMLCINCDITEMLRVQEIVNSYMGSEKSEGHSENSPQDVMSIIDQLILSTIGTSDVRNLTRRRCVEIVRFMDEKGIFLVKGALEKVADIMGVSKVTIYSYLDEAKGKRG